MFYEHFKDSLFLFLALIFLLVIILHVYLIHIDL